MLIPLHALVSGVRPGDALVCHDGWRFVRWAEVSSRIECHAAGFARHREARWLLTEENPLDFLILLLAILYAGKQVVIPPNPHPGTLGALEGEFDAHATREICGPTTALKLIDPRQAIINI